MNFPVAASSTAVDEQTEGGRFDFDDGGSYVGDWKEAKAHGLGLVTGPRGQGQFAGYWENGFESCGVYIWPSGNTYEGQWLHGKRQGVGVERKGRWIYQGDWTTGFKGRYGVRQSTASGAKYEGAWNTGLQEGLGVETYADGGTFAGMWLHGTREGAGVRQSVPYGLACHYRDERCLRDSLTSMRSMDDDEVSVQERQRKLDEARGGFVLTGRGDPHHAPVKKNPDKQRGLIKKTLLSKLRKQRSTGDINESPNRHPHHSGRHFGGSIRSTISANSHMTGMTDGSALTAPETSAYWNSDIIDPSITERYMGHWKQDKRSGFGVAERSDGLVYLGEWMNNKKHGYGITYFPDGSHESGKYKVNVLVLSTAKRNKLFALRTSRLKERVNEAKMQAELAQNEAKKKETLAFQKQATARESARSAAEMAEQAREYADLATIKSRDYAPEFYQPGEDYMKRREESENAGHMASSVPNKSQHLKVNGGPAAVGRSLQRQPAITTGDYEDSDRDSHRDSLRIPSGGAAPGSGAGLSNTLSPNVLCDGTLQVGGGGSRRGSFRAVRRSSTGSRVAEEERIEAQESVPVLRSRRPQNTSNNRRGLHAEQNAKLSDLLNSTTLTDHFDQYSTLQRKRDSGLGRDSSLDESTNGGTSTTIGSGTSAVSSGVPNRRDSDTPDSGMSDVSGASRTTSGGRSRRRTMPSLMTAPPVQPLPVNPPPDEYAHSLENLVEAGPTIYIIENGIRKRVQADYQQSSHVGPNQTAAQSRAPASSVSKRSAMRHYKIESQAQLAKDLGEGSIPDVSVCRHIKQHSLMSREEVARLSQARRQELLRQEQRRKQGEIIIRMADLKDWCREHIVVLFVLCVNTALAVLFLTFLATPKS